jgi:hypothetical protein
MAQCRQTHWQFVSQSFWSKIWLKFTKLFFCKFCVLCSLFCVLEVQKVASSPPKKSIALFLVTLLYQMSAHFLRAPRCCTLLPHLDLDLEVLEKLVVVVVVVRLHSKVQC